MLSWFSGYGILQIWHDYQQIFIDDFWWPVLLQHNFATLRKENVSDIERFHFRIIKKPTFNWFVNYLESGGWVWGLLEPLPWPKSGESFKNHNHTVLLLILYLHSHPVTKIKTISHSGSGDEGRTHWEVCEISWLELKRKYFNNTLLIHFHLFLIQLVIVCLKMASHIFHVYSSFANTGMTSSTVPRTAQSSKNSGEFDILGILIHQMILILWAYSLISKIRQVHFLARECHHHYRPLLLNVRPSTDLRGVWVSLVISYLAVIVGCHW